MRTITLEFLRHGPAHNQLLSRLTDYLALCGNHGAQTVQMPFDHNQLLHRLHALEYESDERSRQFQLEDTAQTLSGVLGEVSGLTAELGRQRECDDEILHLRLVISASELALVPFELADAPNGFPGAGQSLLLQNQLPVCITREVRRAADARFEWPRRPKILFIVAAPPDVGSVPLDAHVLALRKVLEPWVNSFGNPAARAAEVAEFLTILPEATVDQVQRTCAAEAFTHVHILAHGIQYWDGEDYRFGLAFHPRDPSSPRDIVSGPRLATLLRAVQEPVGRKLACPAVVTLACCNSGKVGSVAGAGSSVAHALHGSGIPVVIASQFPLTFAGSVLMVEIVYEGLLHGLDPRSILNNLRRQLRAREPQSHDWASIVAYASLPPDFDKQLPDVQIQQAREVIERVLKEADHPQHSDWWKAARSVDGVAGESQGSAEQSLGRYRKKIAEAEQILQSVLTSDPDRADEVLGLMAGTKKREAQVLHQLSQLVEGDAKAKYTQESRDALKLSLEHYVSCLRAKPNSSWPLHQVLSLSLALGDAQYRHGEIWLQALSMGLATLRHDKPEKAMWAHSDLIELYLLACDTNQWNGGTQVKTCLVQLHPELAQHQERIAQERALFHAQELVRLHGKKSFPVETTMRQIMRYRRWLTTLEGALFGQIASESNTLLNVLSP